MEFNLNNHSDCNQLNLWGSQEWSLRLLVLEEFQNSDSKYYKFCEIDFEIILNIALL